MTEEDKIVATIDYINDNNIGKKYFKILSNITDRYKNIQLLYRVKEKESAIEKMKIREFISMKQISDFLGYMIITDQVSEIYKIKKEIEEVLGKGDTEDYIKNPKYDGYQSLHLNYNLDKNISLEIQIKTKKMKFAQDIVHDKIYKNFEIPVSTRKLLGKLTFEKILSL